MEMEMLMRIHMIERQATLLKPLELRSDFDLKLAPDAGTEEEFEPGSNHIIRKPPLGIDEIRNGSNRRHRCPLRQNDVQTDTQIGQAPGTRNGIVRSIFPYHKAGTRQNASLMGRFNRFIHGLIESEIIGRDNDPFQLAT